MVHFWPILKCVEGTRIFCLEKRFLPKLGSELTSGKLISEIKETHKRQTVQFRNVENQIFRMNQHFI